MPENVPAEQPKNTQKTETTTPVKKSGSKNFLTRIVGVIILILLVIGVWYFLSNKSSVTPLSSGTIDKVVIGVKSAPLGFYGQKNVEYENPTFNFNSNIFEGLTTFDKDLKFPSRQLVESWDNPSDTTWRIRLRKGVMFHNGEEFTAEDAKFSIDFGKKYVVADDLASIKTVRIIDPYTIEIDTNGPSPLLLNNLINTYVLNKKQVDASGGIKTEKAEDGTEISYIDMSEPIGTGPYKFASRNADEYTLIANESYYLGAPKIKNVVYKVIEDNNARIDSLLSGKTDLVEDIPSNRISEIKARSDLSFKGAPSLRVIYLGMDVTSNKLKYSSSASNPFKKKEVRLALYKGINENEIISQVMGGNAYPASQPATQVNFGFNPNIERVTYDPTGAKDLLTKAGYPNGFDVTLDVPNNRYHNDEAIGKKVVFDLAKIGIKVTLNALPKETYFEKVLEPNYDTSFYLLGWSQDNGDAGGAYGTLIHSRDADKGYGGFNIGNYKNTNVDKAIEASDQTINSVERQKILQNLAKMVMDEVAIIPLHQQQDSFALNNKFDWTPRRDNGVRAFEISVK